MESSISWKDKGGRGGGVISLTTVDWRKGCWGLLLVSSVCMCVWIFGRMRVSAKLSIQVSKLKFIL